MRPDRLRHSVNATEVGVNFLLPSRFRKLGDTAEYRDSGIVDENIDFAACQHGFFDQPRDVAPVGDVDANRKRGAALLGDRMGDRPAPIAIEIGANDRRAFLGEAYRRLAANARGRSGNNRVLSGESHRGRAINRLHISF